MVLAPGTSFLTWTDVLDLALFQRVFTFDGNLGGTSMKSEATSWRTTFLLMPVLRLTDITSTDHDMVNGL